MPANAEGVGWIPDGVLPVAGAKLPTVAPPFPAAAAAAAAMCEDAWSVVERDMVVPWLGTVWPAPEGMLVLLASPYGTVGRAVMALGPVICVFAGAKRNEAVGLEFAEESAAAAAAATGFAAAGLTCTPPAAVVPGAREPKSGGVRMAEAGPCAGPM